MNFNFYKKEQLNNDKVEVAVNKYDPFHIPPNLIECNIHKIASQFGSPIDHSVVEQEKQQIHPNVRCICCGEDPKQMFNFNCDLTQISKVNEPVGFYFIFLKYMMAALLTMLVISGIYTFMTTIEFCQNHSCSQAYGIPFPETQAVFTPTGISLNVVAAFVMYIFVLMLYYKNVKVHLSISGRNNKPSDFSVLISGVDHSKINEKDILRDLVNLPVQHLLFTHKIGKYLPLLSKRNELEAKKNLFYKRGWAEKYARVEKQIIEIDEELIQFKNKLIIGEEASLRTDKVIIRFKTREIKELFVDLFELKFHRRLYYLFSGKSQLQINQVPIYLASLGEPLEVIWENLEYSYKYRYLMVFINSLVTLAILFASFAIILVLNRTENQDAQNNDIILYILMSFFIMLVNFILNFVIFQLTLMEKRHTLTGQNMAKIIRNVIAFSLNTTLIPFSMFVLDWFYQEKSDILQYVLTLFIVNNLVSPFTVFISPGNFQSWYMRRKIQKEGKDCLISQRKANKYYQKLDFKLQLKYQLICQRIINCMFYASIFPQGILLTVVGLVISYFIDKFWLVRYCSIPIFSFRLSKMIVLLCFQYLQNDIAAFFPPVYLFGYAANLYMARTDKYTGQNPIIIVYIAVFATILSVLIFLFAERIVTNIIKSKEKMLHCEMDAEQADYIDLNPTSFFNKNLMGSNFVVANNKPECMWGMLEEYAKEKDRVQLRRDTTNLGLSKLVSSYRSKIKQKQ